MKLCFRSVFLVFMLMFYSITGFSQFISIQYPGYPDDISGSYSIVRGASTDSDLNQRFWIFNETSQSIDVSCSRVEIAVPGHTKNATCWRVCPPKISVGASPSWTSPHIQTIEVGESDATFSAHLYPEGTSGCSHFRYYFFIDGQPTMIDSVDVYFEHGQICQEVASINQTDIQSLSFSVFPNPSNGTVNLDLQVPSSKNYVLNVVNVVGQNVISNQKITNGVSKLDWSHLNPGMYFVMLFDGDKAIKTKKIQIVR